MREVRDEASTDTHKKTRTHFQARALISFKPSVIAQSLLIDFFAKIPQPFRMEAVQVNIATAAQHIRKGFMTETPETF